MFQELASTVVVLCGAALLSAAPAVADENDYIALLDGQDVTYSSPESAIGIGQGICQAFDSGTSLPRIINALHQRGWETPREQAVIIGSAGIALCPSIGPIIRSQLATLSRISG